MNLPFVLAMVRREGTSSRRRLGLYMGSISLGVAALVSINSFRANVTEAIRAESRGLLGADVELRSVAPFPAPAQAVLDSAAAAGTPVSYVTSLASMALAPSSDLPPRLVDLRAVQGDYPYYGAVETNPAEAWQTFRHGARALVDHAVLLRIGAAVGDTLAIGDARFEISGTLTRVPGDVGFTTTLGPRVYIPASYLDETGLIGFGSRTVYRAYLKFESQRAVDDFLERHESLLRQHRVRWDTATEREEEFTEALDVLGRFLGLVGLIALLLGGIGVASAVHVFVKDKIPTVAVLRCLGAAQSTVFAMYLLQAALLGMLGAAVGAALGVGVQMSLPGLLRDFLPIEVPASIEWPALLVGMVIGTWVAVVFALLPLLEVRNVAPLQALRRDYEAGGRRSRLRWASYAVIVGTLLALGVWEAPHWGVGLAFAGALTGTSAALWAIARLLIRGTRRFFPRTASYVVRQGIANLHRPRNQTVTVTITVGFGVFLIASLYVVQRNLLDTLSPGLAPTRPSVVLFDVQPDQRDSIVAMLTSRGFPLLDATPIVPARIAAVNGRPVTEMLADTTDRTTERWPLRREYRNTYRDTLVSSEELVRGSWWTDPSGILPRISVEEDLAAALQVDVGDRLTWDVQGVEIETEIANLRAVDWARLEPNFFVVFEPGALADAPQTFVILTRDDDPVRRAELQRDVVMAHSNVAIVDLAVFQETIRSILRSVVFAIRFMALFSIVSGLIVLAGSIATSRFQRVRESVLLRTLGARRRQISHILFIEYSSLGLLSGLAGCVLGLGAGWALVTFFFELDFRPPTVAVLALWFGTAAATALIGWMNSRDVLRRPPLAVIRELGE